MKCLKCEKEFVPTKGLLNYCSLQCRNSRLFSEESRLKKSISAKRSEKVKNIKRKGRKGVPNLKARRRFIWQCPVCNKKIELRNFERNRKYCSGSCRNKINNQLIFGTRSNAERHLEKELTERFPDLEIIFNSRKILSNNKELDVYFPTLNLAIEWNGIWHYKNIRKNNNDEEKKIECKEKGIELITVKDLTSSLKFIREETEKIIKYVYDVIG